MNKTILVYNSTLFFTGSIYMCIIVVTVVVEYVPSIIPSTHSIVFKESRLYVFPFRMMLFYLVTTGWILTSMSVIIQSILVFAYVPVYVVIAAVYVPNIISSTRNTSGIYRE